MIRWRALTSLALLAVLLRAPPAAADEPDAAPVGPKPSSIDELSAPRLPAPFIMPDLSHEAWDLGIGWLLGIATARRDGGTSPVLGLARASVEGDIVLPRRFYVGATLPFATALAPDGSTTGAKTVLGNVEVHARIVFPLPSWLAFGAVFGVAAPTARFDKESGARAAATLATSLEPTDAVYFQPDAIALRPAMDMRILRGPFIVQARQGVDVVIDGATGRTVTTGRFLGHVGVHMNRDLEVSFEVTQIYLFDDKVSDSRRTAITLGPGVRFSLGSVDIGAAVVTSLFAPLSNDIDRFLALRISLVAHLQ